MKCCWTPVEENYTCEWLYRLALLWVERRGRVLGYVCDSDANWFCLCFRKTKVQSLMSNFSYKYLRSKVKPHFPVPEVSSQFSSMLTSEPPSQYSVPVFIIKVTGCSVILDSVLCLHLYLIVWESLCFWTCAAQSRTGRLQRQIKQETWWLCSGVWSDKQRSDPLFYSPL